VLARPRADALDAPLGQSIAGASAPGGAAQIPTVGGAAAVARPAAAAASGHTQVLVGSRTAAVWAARLAALGILATCLVGSGLAALWGAGRLSPEVRPALAPVPPPVVPTSGVAPRALTITHSGPDAAEAIRTVAPNLDPRLRNCVDVSRHDLGRVVAAYTVHLDRLGNPSRLERTISGGTPEEYACIEAALGTTHWPPPSGEYATATVILMPSL
jgi:hypothetical protein